LYDAYRLPALLSSPSYRSVAELDKPIHCLHISDLNRHLRTYACLTMLDPIWTGTDFDRREMRTLKLEQVVRVSLTPN
jgi:hypothetical protein